MTATPMLITWCRECLGIALPHIRGAKSRVRWQCPICAPSEEQRGRFVYVRHFVEVIEEPVEPHVYSLWAEAQHGLELSVMAGEPVPYVRDQFFRDAGLEAPALTIEEPTPEDHQHERTSPD